MLKNRTDHLAPALCSAALVAFPGRLPEKGSEKLAGWARNSASGLQRKPYPLQATRMIEITGHDLLDIPIAPQIPERLLREHGMLCKEFDFLRKTGNIPASTPWEKIRDSVDTGMPRAVLSDSKRYRLEQSDYRNQNQAGGAP